LIVVASYPGVGELAVESAWAEELTASELADVLRSAMREEYADASDEEMGDAHERPGGDESVGGIQLRVCA
jgi:hypothetical protein